MHSKTFREELVRRRRSRFIVAARLLEEAGDDLTVEQVRRLDRHMAVVRACDLLIEDEVDD